MTEGNSGLGRTSSLVGSSGRQGETITNTYSENFVNNGNNINEVTTINNFSANDQNYYNATAQTPESAHLQGQLEGEPQVQLHSDSHSHSSLDSRQQRQTGSRQEYGEVVNTLLYDNLNKWTSNTNIPSINGENQLHIPASCSGKESLKVLSSSSSPSSTSKFISNDSKSRTQVNTNKGISSKRKRGRPPGSLNRKTLLRLRQEKEFSSTGKVILDMSMDHSPTKINTQSSDRNQVKQKRGPGRPPRSLNRLTMSRMESQMRQNQSSNSIDTQYDDNMENTSFTPKNRANVISPVTDTETPSPIGLNIMTSNSRLLSPVNNFSNQPSNTSQNVVSSIPCSASSSSTYSMGPSTRSTVTSTSMSYTNSSDQHSFSRKSSPYIHFQSSSSYPHPQPTGGSMSSNNGILGFPPSYNQQQQQQQQQTNTFIPPSHPSQSHPTQYESIPSSNFVPPYLVPIMQAQTSESIHSSIQGAVIPQSTNSTPIMTPVLGYNQNQQYQPLPQPQPQPQPQQQYYQVYPGYPTQYYNYSMNDQYMPMAYSNTSFGNVMNSPNGNMISSNQKISSHISQNALGANSNNLSFNASTNDTNSNAIDDPPNVDENIVNNRN